MRFLADWWVVCPVFGWFVDDLDGLWVVSSFTANAVTTIFYIKINGLNKVSYAKLGKLKG